MTKTISSLAVPINAFVKAKLAYDDPGIDGDDSALYEAFEAAEHAVVVQPCHTLADVREKASFFLNNPGPLDTIQHCATATGERVMVLFLRSLLGGSL